MKKTVLSSYQEVRKYRASVIKEAQKAAEGKGAERLFRNPLAPLAFFVGILFLIAMSERKWAISTYGFGTEAFTDAGQEYIMKQIRPALSDGNHYQAFMSYAVQADDFLE